MNGRQTGRRKSPALSKAFIREARDQDIKSKAVDFAISTILAVYVVWVLLACLQFRVPTALVG